MRNLAIDYKGFYITLEIRADLVHAFWCNDKFDVSRTFLCYSIEEIKDFIFDDINARETHHA
jgi:hypothetical protein